jgi:membrane-associated phospholipid phosphatase
LGLSLKKNSIREFGLLTSNGAILSSLLTLTLKVVIISDRPDGSSDGRYDSSFPSGHASGTAALAAPFINDTAWGMPFHFNWPTF